MQEWPLGNLTYITIFRGKKVKRSNTSAFGLEGKIGKEKKGMELIKHMNAELA